MRRKHRVFIFCYYEIEKTRYDSSYNKKESVTTYFSTDYMSLIKNKIKLKKRKKKKVNTTSFQISNCPCFLISFCSKKQQMVNKAIGENAKFPEIESVILIRNSLGEILQGLHLSFASEHLCGGKLICIFRGKIFFLLFIGNRNQA